MDGNPYRRTPPGLKSRFTAAEIAQIRDVYDRWNAIRRERIRICKALDLKHNGFNRIGAGKLGKNPRD